MSKQTMIKVSISRSELVDIAKNYLESLGIGGSSVESGRVQVRPFYSTYCESTEGQREAFEYGESASSIEIEIYPRTEDRS